MQKQHQRALFSCGLTLRAWGWAGSTLPGSIRSLPSHSDQHHLEGLDCVHPSAAPGPWQPDLNDVIALDRGRPVVLTHPQRAPQGTKATVPPAQASVQRTNEFPREERGWWRRPGLGAPGFSALPSGQVPRPAGDHLPGERMHRRLCSVQRSPAQLQGNLLYKEPRRVREREVGGLFAPAAPTNERPSLLRDLI